MNFFPPKTLELTIALIKPHAAKMPHVVKRIKEDILNNNFYIIRYKKINLSVVDAEEMYQEHKGKPFFERLVNFMNSGPIECFLLAREKGIETWRKMMGPTRTFDAIYQAPGTYRGMYGISNTKNATHGSDSVKSALRESAIFFKEFNFEDWYKNEEIYFRNGYACFNECEFIHVKEAKIFPILKK